MAGTVRNIVSIDREKCNGCGACVAACHEGAIRMTGGKAELVSDMYCDGLAAVIVCSACVIRSRSSLRDIGNGGT